MQRIIKNEPVIDPRRIEYCHLCRSKSLALYRGLSDRLYNAQGSWDFRQCQNPACGLVWIDPQPLVEEISKAFDTYETHEIKQQSWLKKWIKGILGVNIEKQIASFGIDKLKPGKLLDVGCGSGELLYNLKRLGWDAEGVEVDPKAASIARSHYQVEVFEGALEEAKYADGTYDVIVINHVIEHLRDPIGLLSECRRILKRNGVLLSLTPNIESWAHRCYKSSWLHLDPPRHIFLFSNKTMAKCAQKAGFNDINIKSQDNNSIVVFISSEDIKRKGRHAIGGAVNAFLFFKGLIMMLIEKVLIRFDADLGEEILLKAKT